MSEYRWDEPKRKSNLEQHKLDFQDVDLVFESEYLISNGYPDPRTGELRFIASGHLAALAVEVVFCRRGDTIRVISFHQVKRGKREQLNASLQQRRIEGDAPQRRIADRFGARESDDG